MKKTASILLLCLILGSFQVQTTYSKLSEETFLSLDENFALDQKITEESDQTRTLTISNCQTLGMNLTSQTWLPPGSFNGNYAISSAVFSATGAGSTVSYGVAYSNNTLVTYYQSLTSGVVYSSKTIFSNQPNSVANELSAFTAGAYSAPIYALSHNNNTANCNFALSFYYGNNLAVYQQKICDTAYFGKVKFYQVGSIWYAIAPSSSFRIFQYNGGYLFNAVYDGTASQFSSSFYAGNSYTGSLSNIQNWFWSPASQTLATTNVFQASGQVYLAYNYINTNTQKQTVDIISITTPTSPSMISQSVISFSDFTNDAEAFTNSNVPYVAYSNSQGLYIYSYATAKTPSLVNTQVSGSQSYAVSSYTQQGLNYLAYGSSGIYTLLDVTTVASPKLIKNVTPQIGNQVTTVTIFQQSKQMVYNILFAVATYSGFEVDFYGTTICTTCNLGYYWNTANYYCTICPNGGYYANGACQICNSQLNCGSCSNQTACLTCTVYPYIFLSLGACVQNCPAGTMPVNGICQQCQVSNCDTCQSLSTCNTCNYLYPYYINNQCLANCPAGQYPMYNQCWNCTAGCGTCTYIGTCTTCNTSGTTPYMSNSLCVSSCPTGTVSVGFQCTSCGPNCASCVGTPNNCTSCQNTYYLQIDTNKCINQCSTNYSDQTVSGQLQCIPCKSPCGSCFGSTLGSIYAPSKQQTWINNCLSCTTSSLILYYKNNTCLSCPTGQAILSSGLCGICPSNWYISAGVCQGTCDSSCLTCSGPSYSNCLTCASTDTSGLPLGLNSQNQCSANGYIYNGKIVSACPAGYIQMSLYTQLCKPCMTGCPNCRWLGNAGVSCT